MALVLFENYSSTENLKRKEQFQPLKVKLSANRATDLLTKHLEEIGYDDLVVNKNYGDVCVLIDNFEISYQLMQDPSNGTTIVNVSVYGEHKKGKTRKKLTLVLEELKEVFKSYLYEVLG